MIGGGIARRYIQPLFEVSQEHDVVDKISDDLKTLDSTLQDSRELKSFLNDPSIERQAKRDVIEKVFSDFSDYTKNFMRVVIDKNRTQIFDLAYRLFRDLYDSARGVVNGVVYSVKPIEDEIFDQIKRELESRMDSKLSLVQERDERLLGGLRIQIGNTVIDSSVKGRLTKLKEQLAGA